MRTSYLLSATATVVVGLTGSAYAGTLDLTVSVPNSESVSWTPNTLANLQNTGDGASYTGQIILTAPGGQEYSGWCVDLFHTVGIGSTDAFTPGPLTTDNSGTDPATSNPLTSNQGVVGSSPTIGSPQTKSSSAPAPARGMNLAPVQVEHAHGDGARRPVCVDDKCDRANGVSGVGEQ
jgi:hypothetical protein